MRSIKLKNYNEVGTRIAKVKADHRKYAVPIGNGYIGYFNSKHQVNKFLGETGKFLTFQLLQLNSLYGRAFILWRQVWPLLGGRHKNKKLDGPTIERELKQHLTTIEHKLHYMEKNRHSENYNYIAFHDLQAITSAIVGICNTLKTVLKSHNNTVSIYEAEILAQEGLRIGVKLQHYGFKELTEYSTEVVDYEGLKIA